MNSNRTGTAEKLINEVRSKLGKAGGWPNYFGYDIDGDCITISVNEDFLQKKVSRGLDPWGLALFDKARGEGIKINTLNFVISGQIQIHNPYLEALRRRVSFLSMNNAYISFEITLNGKFVKLYSAQALFNRPEGELIRNHFGRGGTDNKPGRIEKDFQTFLFGYRIEKDDKTNERLAVLGFDFFNLKKRGLGIIREFPTGSFLEKITNKNRILPTEFVDIVTLNKHGKLAIIELKINDSQLEVIAQLVDYSLFFRCYIDKLLPIIKDKLRHNPKDKEFICYVVNNHFHDKFDDVIKYYGTKNKSYGFRIAKVVLGDCKEV